VSDFEPGTARGRFEAGDTGGSTRPDATNPAERVIDALVPPTDRDLPAFTDIGFGVDAGDASPAIDAGLSVPDAGDAGCRIRSLDPPGASLRIHVAGWSDATTTDTTTVSFEVRGLDDAPLRGVDVVFEALGDAANVGLRPAHGRTDAAGRVSTDVTSRTPGRIRIRASAPCGGGPAVGPVVNVAGGPPSLRGFELTCTPTTLPAIARRERVRNVDEWQFTPGAQLSCTAQLADHFGDAIGPGVDVTFRTESGVSPGVVSTDENGRARATLLLGQPEPVDLAPAPYELALQAEWARRLPAEEMRRRAEFNPRDAVVRVIATTAGMEAFVDTDGDGAYTDGVDPFGLEDDLNEPFVDGNDNGTWDEGEPFQDRDGDGLFTRADGLWTAETLLWRGQTVLFTGPPDATVSWLDAVRCDAGDAACRPCRAESGCVPVAPAPCDANAIAALRPGGEVDLQVIVADVNGNCPLAAPTSTVRFPAGPGWVSEPESLSGDALLRACFGGTATEPMAAPLRFRLRDTRAEDVSSEPEQAWLETSVTYEAGHGRPGELRLVAPVCLLPSEDAPGPTPDAMVPVDALVTPDGQPDDARLADVAMPDARVPDASTPDASTPDAQVVDAALADAAVADAAAPDAAVWGFPRHVSPAGLELIGLPAGTFVMGLDQPGSALIAHEVTLSRPFWLGRTEVTVGEWHTAWLSNPAYVAWERPSQRPDCGDCPVEGVSWQDFARFANVLSDAEGLERCYTYEGDAVRAPYAADPYSCPGYRFPTSAEWEYAARAGTGATYQYPGSDDPGEIGWLVGTSAGSTHPVGQLLPNAWGFVDLCGNVSEYTSEWAGPIPTIYSPQPVTDPWGPPTGDPNGWVVFRGDHFRTGPTPMWLPPGAVSPAQLGLNSVGARIARTMQPPP
jgi:formylglycine-generating enzyme required for sulfatase activity